MISVSTVMTTIQWHGTIDAPVRDAMTSPIQIVRADSNLKECVCAMEEAQVRRAPVVDASGRLAGIVALADIALAGKQKAAVEVVNEVFKPELIGRAPARRMYR